MFCHGRDDAGLVADLDAQGIDRCWLLTWELPAYPVYQENLGCGSHLNPVRARPDGLHPGITLADLLVAHDHFPGRFDLGYCPDPQHAERPGIVRPCGQDAWRGPVRRVEV